MRSITPTRQAAVFVGIAFPLALLIALALPHAGIAPLLSLLVPAVAVAVTIQLTCRRGERRRAWAAIGWRLPPWRAVALAMALPAAVAAISYGVAAAFGIARYPGLFSLDTARHLTGWLLLGHLMYLGEEIGWRGFLLPRLAMVLRRPHAWLATGAIHAAFHLPLLTLTTTYQSAGNRWIVVPMVMVTLTFGGVFYAWIRDAGNGSVWPVAVAHNAFNTFFELFAGLAVTTSAATLAYVTTETGVATMITVVLAGGWLLTHPPAASRSQVADRVAPERV